MFIISLKGDEITNYKAKTLGYLFDMKVCYGKRFKRYEFRGAIGKHKKLIPIFEMYAKLNKLECWNWTVKKDNYKEDYIIIKG